MRLLCEQPSVDYRFLIHTNQPILHYTCKLNGPKRCSIGQSTLTLEAPPIPSPSQLPQSKSPEGNNEPESSAKAQLRHAAEVSKLPPSAALEKPAVVHLFSHWIGTIAPWYDLNDATNTFSNVVTAHALEFPVLFRAIIAVSGIHYQKTTGGSLEVPFGFYAACVEGLVEALEDLPSSPEWYLAAACILQLYEILNGTGRPLPLSLQDISLWESFLFQGLLRSSSHSADS